MLVFNYTLNICSAVGIRVAPIRTSFRTPPPLLPVTGFRFLVISSLVYILSRRLSRSMYSFFFFPPFRAFQSTLSPQGERPLFQITRRKLVYRSLGGLGPVVFLFFSSLFSFFDQETEDTVGFFGSLTRTFSRSCGTGLIMTGKRREGRERERGEGLKHRHPKIRQRKFYWKSSLRIMRRYPIFDEYAILMSHLPSRYRIN